MQRINRRCYLGVRLGDLGLHRGKCLIIGDFCVAFHKPVFGRRATAGCESEVEERRDRSKRDLA